MKIASIYLQNYIGIYNGMGLREIFIDFSIGSHRIVVIRGDNGSGKSTIMKSLSIFPDSNDSFIPGEMAKKEIVVVDNDISYIITFIHPMKSNGMRDTTKAYIKKNVGGMITELNENGNVSSYRDIIGDELSLDPSFESLSQLSTEDRGIADKKPAERKRFVNKILDNLEAYNSIYKSFNKLSSNYKNLINSITAKLNIIGKPEAVAASIATLDKQLNQLRDNKDQLIEKLATQKATMSVLDPDGSIQALIDKLSEENINLENEKHFHESSLMKEKLAAGIDVVGSSKRIYDATKLKIDSIHVDSQIIRGQVESLLKEQESALEERTRKLARLNSFEEVEQYEKICDTIAIEEQAAEDMKNSIFMQTGIMDPSVISKEGFIAALDSLKSIIEYINSIRESCDNGILTEVLDIFYKTKKLPSVKNPKPIIEQDSNINQQIQDIKIEIGKLEFAVEQISVLKYRPSDCKIDTCQFIKSALEFEKSNPKQSLQDAYRKLEELKSLSIKNSEILHSIEGLNFCITQLSNLLRSIDGAAKLVSKFPFADIFKDKVQLVHDIFTNNLDAKFATIYRHIDIANIFDEYKNTIEGIARLKAELQVYESKHQVIDEIQQDLQAIDANLNKIQESITPIQNKLSFNDNLVIELEGKLTKLTSILDREKKIEDLDEALKKNQATYNENIVKIKQIKAAAAIAVRIANEIDAVNEVMKPIELDRDRLNHQLRMIDDYKNELDTLGKYYNWIEIIKKYSSPTTGIQLFFMQAYMGNIIDEANRLLSMFFGGTFRIMPFVINETEFRIPCAGEGIMNDDISSMSSAQIAMISMILSFSFLKNSSSRFNILKLDEIDGPLDGNNRIMFVDVLTEVMDMMHVEQCIMISHNSELQVDKADIILLRSSENSQYESGNVIWKF